MVFPTRELRLLVVEVDVMVLDHLFLTAKQVIVHDKYTNEYMNDAKGLECTYIHLISHNRASDKPHWL